MKSFIRIAVFLMFATAALGQSTNYIGNYIETNLTVDTITGDTHKLLGADDGVARSYPLESVANYVKSLLGLLDESDASLLYLRTNALASDIGVEFAATNWTAASTNLEDNLKAADAAIGGKQAAHANLTSVSTNSFLGEGRVVLETGDQDNQDAGEVSAAFTPTNMVGSTVKALLEYLDDQWDVIGAGASGTDTNAIHTNAVGEINALTSKTTAVAADVLLIEDSAASYAKKKATISGIKSALESSMALQNIGGAVTDSQVPNGITIDLAATASVANSGDSATSFFPSGTVEADRLPNLSAMNGQIGDAQIGTGAVDGGPGGEIADESITADDLGPDSVSASELNATGVESELEAVLDLPDLQGAVTDAQVPNSITIDLATQATTALAGDSATAFFPSGTVEAARLPALSGLTGQIADAQIADGAVDGGTGGEIADDSITAADLAPDSVGASELNAADVESELEAVLDIGDLQGQVDASQINYGSTMDGQGTGKATNFLYGTFGTVRGTNFTLLSGTAGTVTLTNQTWAGPVNGGNQAVTNVQSIRIGGYADVPLYRGGSNTLDYGLGNSGGSSIRLWGNRVDTNNGAGIYFNHDGNSNATLGTFTVGSGADPQNLDLLTSGTGTLGIAGSVDFKGTGSATNLAFLDAEHVSANTAYFQSVTNDQLTAETVQKTLHTAEVRNTTNVLVDFSVGKDFVHNAAGANVNVIVTNQFAGATGSLLIRCGGSPITITWTNLYFRHSSITLPLSGTNSVLIGVQQYETTAQTNTYIGVPLNPDWKNG